MHKKLAYSNLIYSIKDKKYFFSFLLIFIILIFITLGCTVQKDLDFDISRIIDSGDYYMCEKTVDSVRCLKEIALYHASVDSCYYLMDISRTSAEECLFSYLELAVDSRTQRKIVDDERNYYLIPLRYNYDSFIIEIDESYCNNITERNEECLSLVAGLKSDPEKCIGFRDPYKDICLANVAILKGDSSLCRDIVDPFSEYYCLSTIALLTDNILDCTYIKESYLAAECIKDLSAFQKNDSYCVMSAYLKDFKQEWVFDCFKQVAIAQKNPSLCVDIIDPKLRGECYSEVAVFQNNISLCESTNAWNECLVKIAFKNNDLEICKKTQDPDLCILFIHKIKEFDNVQQMYRRYLENIDKS